MCKRCRTGNAAVFAGIRTPFEIRNYPIAEPPEGCVGLELLASGVCGTDIHFYEGRLSASVGQIIGHEFVGRVDAVNADCGLKPGDNAIVEIAIPCGKCELCLAGDAANCPNMNVTNGSPAELAPHFHGGFCDYTYAPPANIVKLADGIDPIAAAVFACPGPTAIHGWELAKRGGVTVDEIKKAAVQGLGPVGMFAVLYLKKLGVPEVIAITNRRDDARMALARELGADAVYCNETDADTIASLNGFDLVFEGSGSPKAIPTGMALLRNRGVYLIPGQYSASGTVEISPEVITFKALRIFGSSQYNYEDVVTYADFLDTHRESLPTIRKLAAAYKVSEINEAFTDALARKNVKTVLVKGE